MAGRWKCSQSPPSQTRLLNDCMYGRQPSLGVSRTGSCRGQGETRGPSQWCQSSCRALLERKVGIAGISYTDGGNNPVDFVTPWRFTSWLFSRKSPEEVRASLRDSRPTDSTRSEV